MNKTLQWFNLTYGIIHSFFLKISCLGRSLFLLGYPFSFLSYSDHRNLDMNKASKTKKSPIILFSSPVLFMSMLIISSFNQPPGTSVLMLYRVVFIPTTLSHVESATLGVTKIVRFSLCQCYIRY